MRISCTDVRGFECPACAATVGEACRGVRGLACHQERWQLAKAGAEILTMDGEGNLANSSGDVIARLVELTVDMSAARLTGGGGHGPAVKAHSSQGDPGTKQKRASADASNTPVARVWAEYQRLIPGASRQALDATKRRIIQNALRVRPEERCIRAIVGLSKSRHHNGENEQRKKYLGIRYALKGNAGRGEGNDERIDKMAEIASSAGSDLLATVPSAGREMVRNRQRLVEEALLHPGDSNRAARAQDSAAYLRETFGLVATVDGDAVKWERTDG